jgi:hypothetical protein
MIDDLPAPFMPPIRKMLRPSELIGKVIAVENWKDL